MSFDPACEAEWVHRGRAPEHAAVIAAAWRRFPDLAADAPLKLRMARSRERVDAMRPAMEAMRIAQDRARQAANFSFTKQQAAKNPGNVRDAAILLARGQHGYDWDSSVQYAQGWYAAHAGWAATSPRGKSGDQFAAAYMMGFRDGGGNPDDLFDAARRSLVAEDRATDEPRRGGAPLVARPPPSSWPLPTDKRRPSLWEKRLLLIGAPEAGLADAGGSALLAPLLCGYPGAGAMTIILVTANGFVPAPELQIGQPPRAELVPLSSFMTDQEFDDVLVAAQGTMLDLIDADARHLPLARGMERTRNSPLQQKAHFRIWMDRGICPGESVGAGHIRWGKAIRGLTGKLGEFTARYAGKDPSGHCILVELAGGAPATGFIMASGDQLDPEIHISNRKHLRTAMASRLRQFGGATRLAPVQPDQVPTPNARSGPDLRS